MLIYVDSMIHDDKSDLHLLLSLAYVTCALYVEWIHIIDVQNNNYCYHQPTIILSYFIV